MLLYSGPFVLLATIPALFYFVGSFAPLATVGLLLAALVGAEFTSRRGAVIEAASDSFGYRILLYAYIPAQLAVIAWAVAISPRLSLVTVLGLAVAVGVTSGVFGMLVAHEMVHSKSWRERLLGSIMLSAMSYRHFRIAHVQGHHRWAATRHDAATAHLGEGFYAFLGRTLCGQFREAFELERRRCRVRGSGVLANRVTQDVLLSVLVLGFIAFFRGSRGVLFFVTQSAIAVVVLEMFNYIAHYGLMRRELAPGRFEALDDRHSWNSSNIAANLLIFNMGRHSFHHRKPAASYEGLRYVQAAPELPAGYAGSILMALVPPLWCAVMDRRVRQLRESEGRLVTPEMTASPPRS